jgi:hypothetical protein
MIKDASTRRRVDASIKTVLFSLLLLMLGSQVWQTSFLLNLHMAATLVDGQGLDLKIQHRAHKEVGCTDEKLSRTESDECMEIQVQDG